MMISSRTVRVSGKPNSVSLQDLRDLVEETKHLSGHHRVSVKGGTDHIRDPYPAELSVTWTPERST